MVVNLATIFFWLLIFSSYIQLSVAIFFFLKKKEKGFSLQSGLWRNFSEQGVCWFRLPTSTSHLPTSHFAFAKPIQVQSIKKETKKHQKKFGHNDKELLSLHPARGQVHINNAQEIEEKE